MGRQVLRPDFTHQSAYWTAVGAASPLAAVTDESDASYVEILGGWIDNFLIFRLANLSPLLPPRAIIRAVTIAVRAKTPSSGWSSLFVWVSFPQSVGLRGIAEVALDPAAVNAGRYTLPFNGGLSQLTRPDGKAWDEAGANDLEVWFSPRHDELTTGDVQLMRVEAAVDYNEPPFATARVPADLATTSRPRLRWLYRDAERDLQTAYHVKLFSGLGDVADPATETARLVWDSGVVLSSADYADPVPVPNGPYRFAVTVSDPGSTGVQEGPANLLTYDESTFQAGVAGWTAGTNATISSAGMGDGNNVMNLQAIAGGNMTAYLSRSITCVPGERVAVDAIFQPASVGRFVLCFIDYFASNGVFVGQTVGPQVAALLQDWTPAQAVGNAPSNAATFRIGVQVIGPAAGEIVRVDEAVQRRANAYWAQESFTLAVTGPQTPSIVATAEASSQRIRLDITAPAVVAPAPAPQYFIVERLGADGATWEYVRGGKRFAPAVPVGTNTLYDYESQGGASRPYRVRSITEATGVPVSSAYSAQATAASIAASTWYLVDFLATAPAVWEVGLAPGINFSRPHRAVMHEPMGSEYNVIVSDGVRGREWPLIIECLDNADFAEVTQAQEVDRTLVLRGPTGQWYVRLFGAMSVTQRRGGTNPERTVSVAAVETGMPTVL